MPTDLLVLKDMIGAFNKGVQNVKADALEDLGPNFALQIILEDSANPGPFPPIFCIDSAHHT